jgi:hypothetical protein
LQRFVITVNFSLGGDEVTTFWQKLRSSVINDKGFLNFEVDNPLVQATVQHLSKNVIFVRQDYKDLWRIMLEKKKKKSKGTKKFIITGTPGVGKGVFLFYILWMLSSDPVARAAGIVYTSKEGHTYVFSDTAVKGPLADITDPAIEAIITNKDAWWLINGKEQGPVTTAACNVVLAASLSKDYQNLAKMCEPLWLPVWDFDFEEDGRDYLSPELHKLREELYPHVAVNDMVEAASIWGPIPGRVFAGYSKEDTEAILDAYVAKFYEPGAQRRFMNGAVPDFAREAVLHPTVDRSTFLVEDWDTATRYVAEKMLDKEKAESPHERLARMLYERNR